MKMQAILNALRLEHVEEVIVVEYSIDLNLY